MYCYHTCGQIKEVCALCSDSVKVNDSNKENTVYMYLLLEFSGSVLWSVVLFYDGAEHWHRCVCISCVKIIFLVELKTAHNFVLERKSCLTRYQCLYFCYVFVVVLFVWFWFVYGCFGRVWKTGRNEILHIKFDS